MERKLTRWHGLAGCGGRLMETASRGVCSFVSRGVRSPALGVALLGSCVFAAPAAPPPDYDIGWITIRDPGNAAYHGFDDYGIVTGRGRVDYTYRMSRLEITTSQWVEFINTFTTQSDELNLLLNPSSPHIVHASGYTGAGGTGLDPPVAGGIEIVKSLFSRATEFGSANSVFHKANPGPKTEFAKPNSVPRPTLIRAHTQPVDPHNSPRPTPSAHPKSARTPADPTAMVYHLHPPAFCVRVFRIGGHSCLSRPACSTVTTICSAACTR